MPLRLKQAAWATCVSVSHRQTEWSRTLVYYSEALEFMRGYIEGYQADIILALCAAELLIFIIILISIMRGRRLRKRVDELTYSVTRLLNEEAARYTRSILGRAKDNDPR
jgi:hypothetical protein